MVIQYVVYDSDAQSPYLRLLLYSTVLVSLKLSGLCASRFQRFLRFQYNPQPKLFRFAADKPRRPPPHAPSPASRLRFVSDAFDKRFDAV